jgi:hypothetical protein
VRSSSIEAEPFVWRLAVFTQRRENDLLHPVIAVDSVRRAATELEASISDHEDRIQNELAIELRSEKN